MKVINNIDDLKNIIKGWKKNGLTIGLVPTMGYLHEGHESLMKKARKENDKVVVSIFVNPIQFGPNEDFASYPRDIEKDSELCRKNDIDLIFNPSTCEMYNKNPLTFVNVNSLTDGLCGAKRVGHFTGVCTVVSKLFNLVSPDKAYFGEKDAQQLIVIKKMVEDLNFSIEVIGCPIIREVDGLAKSSRNSYLSSDERSAALILSKSLKKAKEAINGGIKNSEKIKEIIENEIKKEPLANIDYIEIVATESLKAIDFIESSTLVAIAVYIGKTRLIDNFFYN